jgi:uncharacterized membrane protein YgdD (TMEM256/DUF423 family)
LAESATTVIWEKAVLYHLIHSIAVLAVALKSSDPVSSERPRWCRCAAWAWAIGVLFFSGSLYLLALGGPRWLGPITPLGGTALIVGWILIAFAGFGSRPTSTTK